MPEIVSVGPLRLDGSLLAVLISIVAGLLALAIWIKMRPEKRTGPWVDVFMTAAVIALLGWKLGIVLSDPAIVWQRPAALLIMRGGMMELLIGLAAAAIYLMAGQLRGRIRLWELLAALPFALLPGLVVWSVLHDFPYYIVYAFVWAAVYIWLLWTSAADAVSGRELGRSGLLGLGIGGLAASLFAPITPGGWLQLTLGLTALQWGLIIISAAGALIRPEADAAATSSGYKTDDPSPE
ncbi:hypothetical protein [Paenibacillus sp. GCM10027626]|uniref:hypothetical protein n=1 Tax=Paenibacillus sp. GCM10027626 TaxID=3273411 RepID=UPI003641F40A